MEFDFFALPEEVLSRLDTARCVQSVSNEFIDLPNRSQICVYQIPDNLRLPSVGLGPLLHHFPSPGGKTWVNEFIDHHIEHIIA